MIEIRPFLNTDLPALKAFWNDQVAGRRDLAPVTLTMLESTVLAKPFFDRQGLVLAVERSDNGLPACASPMLPAGPTSDARIVGFVHAGFRADQTRTEIDRSVGQIAMWLVEARDDGIELANRLLDHAEAYLLQQGVREVDQGGPRTINPFYAGLLRTNLTLGLPSVAMTAHQLLTARGYAVSQTSQLWRRELFDFRPPVSRKLLMLRRSHTVVTEEEPTPRNWWEAVTLEPLERTRLAVRTKRDPDDLGEVSLWRLAPQQRGAAGNVFGLINLEIRPEVRREGLGTLLVSEALAVAHRQGADMVDIQLGTSQVSAERFLLSQSFEPIETFQFYHKRF